MPAAYIPMIGVDQRIQGRGFGGDLLVEGFGRIAQAADAIGIAVVMLDGLDCGDVDRVARRRALYEGYGFISLAARPLRMCLPIATLRALLA
jgi:ribosomal protein S18 acetylase RimI-like enzyme